MSSLYTIIGMNCNHSNIFNSKSYIEVSWIVSYAIDSSDPPDGEW